MADPQLPIAIRDAHEADISALVDIWQELMLYHESADERFALASNAGERWCAMARDIIKREDGFLFLAEYQGGSVGFCLGWLAKNPPIYAIPEVGFISEIAVTRRYHRNGIGRALLAAARDWFLQHHVREFQLSTAVWNNNAQAFWLAMGGEPLLLRYRFAL